jgi:acetyl-CoA carboxylase biotin carboxyl carrier protein
MAKSPKATDIDADAVRKLAELLEETGLTEIEYTHDDWSLRVSKGATAVAAAAPVPVAAPAPAADAGGDQGVPAGAVTSPMVGVVYTSPDPDSPPFVKEGDSVKEGDTLMLVEAMKVFNQITAPRAGTVKKILVEGGTPVEFGEPLLILE